MGKKFILVVKQYERNNCTLDDMRIIRIGRTCLVAKNQKYGGLYLHKNAKIIKGKFYDPAGSHSSPILMAKSKEVHIEVTGFDPSLEITTDQHSKQNILSILTPA